VCNPQHRNNIREGGAILEVAMDEDDNYFSKECRTGADIIESYVTEGIPPLPPVELKGFQHLYKSTKTTSRVKELQSLKNDSVIDSNITEGIPSLPPVESKVTAYHAETKVTACHIMCATRSTRNNIREGGIILEVAMDKDDDYFSKECHIGANIIERYVTEGIPPLPPGIPPLPPVELKGFQHLYKSTKTTSSQRVLTSHKATIKHGFARNDNARRRDRRKNRKIHDVEKVKPSPRNIMNMRNVPSSKPVFCSGTSEREVPNQVYNSIVKSTITNMRVVDTVDSAWMDLAPEVNIFVLIPRRAATRNCQMSTQHYCP
jgi:hypothetical protein